MWVEVRLLRTDLQLTEIYTICVTISLKVYQFSNEDLYLLSDPLRMLHNATFIFFLKKRI